MSLPRGSCPENSFLYNASLCACNPGRFLQNGSCVLFNAPVGEWEVSSGVESTPTFLTTVLPLDSIKRLTQSQALVLEATLVMIVAWLLFCFAIRFGKVDGGGSIWFRIRWWISRMDFCFSSRHWVEDGKVVTKRQTELGGTLSVASWILFVGLLTALLYQVITKRSIEVHRVRPTNALDLLPFVNDLEFNITTISSMSCSHLRGLDTLVIGTPGFIDYRVSPLSTYANYYCHNTSRGPTISLKCNSCRVPRGNHYITWQFVDLPSDPAIAVGFEFNLTAKAHGSDKHVSYVSGTLNSESYTNDTPKTFRGPDINILKIHLFPQTYNNLHNLRLIQPLFHDFMPGSSFSEASDLQASLQSSKDGLVNTTLYISYLSDYIVEIDSENVLGPVSFLADVGGLYAISLAIFLYILLQCEARFKKLRGEDSIMRNIRSQRRAQKNWDKLRKYVMYTWGHSNLDLKNINSKQHGNLMIDSFRRIGSLHKTKKPIRKDSIYFDKTVNIPGETNIVPEAINSERIKTSLAGSTTNFDGRLPHSSNEHEILDMKEERGRRQPNASCMGDTSHLQEDLENKKLRLPDHAITVNHGCEISDS